MLFRKPKKKTKKQEALFLEALKEAGFTTDAKAVRIDHSLAKCYYNDQEFNLIFPMRFLRLCRNLNYEKDFDYSFRGLYTPKREWVNRFQGARAKINFTDQGRMIEKDFFDAVYYQEIAGSRFTLCPAGDFKWTYRFFEAIMCHSIPVIERGSDHSQCEGFTYYYSDMEAADLMTQWKENTVTTNYNLFLRRHTLLNLFIFL